MSQGPSTFGIMITSSTSPISETRVVKSSSTQGLSSELTRVHSWQSPKSISRPIFASPSRAAILSSIWIASSRLPSSTSQRLASSGSFAAIFALLGSKKWIMREGRNGTSRGGIGAPIALGRKKSFALRIMALPLIRIVELHDPDRALRRGADAQIAQRALVEVLLDDRHAALAGGEDVDRTRLLERARERGVVRELRGDADVDEQPRHQPLPAEARRPRISAGICSIRSATEIPAASIREIFSAVVSSL